MVICAHWVQDTEISILVTDLLVRACANWDFSKFRYDYSWILSRIRAEFECVQGIRQFDSWNVKLSSCALQLEIDSQFNLASNLVWDFSFQISIWAFVILELSSSRVWVRTTNATIMILKIITPSPDYTVTFPPNIWPNLEGNTFHLCFHFILSHPMFDQILDGEVTAQQGLHEV